jgi:hypothetical protein
MTFPKLTEYAMWEQRSNIGKRFSMQVEAKIYVMKAKDGALKIGRSVKPWARAKQIERKIDFVPYETGMLPNADLIERAAHRVMALFGKHLGGEWFEGSITDAKLAIEIAIRQVQNNELGLGGTLLPNKRRKRTTPLEVFGDHFTAEELTIAKVFYMDAELVMTERTTNAELDRLCRTSFVDTNVFRFRDVIERLDRNSKSVLLNLVLLPTSATSAMKSMAQYHSKFGHAEAQKGVAIGLIKAALWHVGRIYKELEVIGNTLPVRTPKLSPRRQVNGSAQSS